MKTFYLALLMLVGGFLYTSCEEHTAEQPTTKEAHSLVKEPAIIIPVEEAEELYKNYGSLRVPLIEKFQNVDNDGVAITPESDAFVDATRSLSIDYETLKEYMTFIESEASKTKTKITGLRIYFGLYGPKGYNPNSETVFLNPLMEYGKPSEIRDDVSFAVQNIEGKATAVPVGKILGTFETDTKGGTNLELYTQSPVQSLAGNYFPKRPPPPPPKDPDYK